MDAISRVTEFNDYIAKYIKDNACYGQTSFEEVSDFVPRTALEHFWDTNKILDVLCEDQLHTRGSRIDCDLNQIYEHYLVIFSILVALPVPMPRAIRYFTKYSKGDSVFPLTSTPEMHFEEPEYDELLDDIQKIQWKFCPLDFDLKRPRRHDAVISPYQVLPIVQGTKQLIDAHADEEDDDVLVYRVQWHSLCQGSLLVGWHSADSSA
jgi:hypothetical protein